MRLPYLRIGVMVLIISSVTLIVSPSEFVAAQDDPQQISVSNASDIQLLASLGSGRLRAVAWSNSSRYQALSTSRYLFLVDHNTDEVRMLYSLPVDSITSHRIAFSNDENMLALTYCMRNACLSGTGRVLIFDVEEGLVSEVSMPRYSGVMLDISFDPQNTGIWVATTQTIGTNALYRIDLETAEVITITEDLRDVPLRLDGGTGQTFLILTYHEADAIDIIDTSLNQVAFSVEGIITSDFPPYTAFNDNATVLYVVESISSDSFRINAVDLTSQDVTWQREVTGLTSIASVDEYFAIATNGSLEIWDWQSDSLVASSEHGEEIRGLTAISGGNLIFRSGENIWQWNYNDDEPSTLQSLTNPNIETLNRIKSLSVSANENLLAVGHVSGEASLWDLRDFQLLEFWEAHTGRDVYVQFADSDDTLLTTNGIEISLWDAQDVTTSNLSIPLSTEDSSVMAHLAFSTDLQWVAYNDVWGDIVTLQNLVSGEQQEFPYGGTGRRDYPVALSLDGSQLAFGDVQLWDIPNGQQITTLDSEFATQLLTFSPDSTLLVADSSNDNAVLWHISESRPVAELIETWFASYVFSPNSEYLLVNRSSETWLLETATGEEKWRTTFDTNVLCRFSCTFSPDSTLIAMNSEDSIIVVDVQSGEILSTLDDHTAPTNTVVFSPNSHFIVAGGDDGSISIWGIK